MAEKMEERTIDFKVHQFLAEPDCGRITIKPTNCLTGKIQSENHSHQDH